MPIRTQYDAILNRHSIRLAALEGGGASVFHVEDSAYGAVGGDTGDQTAAINAAATAAKAVAGMLVGTPGVTYRCTGALDWEDLRYCDFTGVTIHSTITSGYALTIGGASTPVGGARMTLPKLKSDSTGANGTDGNPLPEGNGLRVRGLQFSEIYLQRINKFETGILLESIASKGLVNNNFYGIDVQDCTTEGLSIFPVDATAWCNQNQLFGGVIRLNTVYKTQVGSAYIRMDMASGGNVPNGWAFYGLNLEDDVPETLDIIEGQENTWYHCRFESTTHITFGANTIRNHIVWGDSISTLINSTTIADSGSRNGVYHPSVGQSAYIDTPTLANEATPTVFGRINVKSGGTTGITDFDNGVRGQELYFLADHAVTITHNASNIKLNGSADFVMVAGDTLHLMMFKVGVWSEVGRMVL